MFLECFASASGRDLGRFARWYHQAGTPEVAVDADFDEGAGTFALTLRQSCPPTPGQDTKAPFVIPIAFGLLTAAGAAIAPRSDDLAAEEAARGVIVLEQATRTVRFTGLAQRPVPSLLRGFSAPVRLKADLGDDDLAVLLTHDGDSFNRWHASQTLAMRLLTRSTRSIREGGDALSDPGYAAALARLLDDGGADPAFTAQCLLLPSEADLANDIGRDVDPDAIHRAREALRAALGSALGARLHALHGALADDGPYSPAAVPAGRRAPAQRGARPAGGG